MSVHTQLSAAIAWQLAPLVRPKYLVLPTKRFVLEETTGTATVSAPLQLTTVMPARVPHVTIEIRDTANRQLVTAIEILSPTNKRGAGRDEYLAKRRHILLSSAHLVEIDLLRHGQRVPMHEPLPEASYFVFVSRVEHRPITDVWPIALDRPLPNIAIPLQAGDDDVVLDLGDALTAVYDRLGLDLAVDYSQPPEVPFQTNESKMARALLESEKKD